MKKRRGKLHIYQPEEKARDAMESAVNFATLLSSILGFLYAIVFLATM